MTISNATPVQFWPASQQTFNEREICGVMPDCFCQPWNCDDEIKIQFKHTAGQSLSLNIFSEDGIIHSIPFTEISTGLYYVGFIPSDLSPELCDVTVIFLIQGNDETQFLLNETFATDLTNWTAIDWTWDTDAEFEFSESETTAEISQSFSERQAGYYRVRTHYEFNAFEALLPYTIRHKIRVFNGPNEIETILDDTVIIFTSNEFTFDEIAYISGSFTSVKFTLEFLDDLPGGAEQVPLAALDQWTGTGWTTGITPSITVGSLGLSGNLQSPNNEITEADYGGARTLIVDFDVVVDGSPDDVEIVITNFTNLCTWDQRDNGSHLNGGDLGGAWADCTSLGVPFVNLPETSDGDYSAGLGNDIHQSVTSALYGPNKKVVLDFEFFEQLPGGTTGNITAICELYNNTTFITDDSEVFSGYGPLQAVFTFNTTATFNRVMIRFLRVGGTSVNIRPRLYDIALYYVETFTTLDLGAQLRFNDSAIIGGSAAPEYTVNGSGSYQAQFDFQVIGTMNNVMMYAANNGTLAATVTINSVYFESSKIHPVISLEYLEMYETDTLLKSDCQSIKTSHECTELIEYSNPEDFDDIVYDISPAPTFFIRIPAQFWKEDNPQEQEDLELSDGEIVTLRQSIQEKRLLEIGYIPNYMHKKIQKILMHKDIEIDGQLWKKRDEYESENIDRYPKKTAECWLTLYNSVERNTL